MSAIIETFLKCDGHATEQCQDSWGVDSRGQDKGPTIKQHRIDAREAGWKKRGILDFCPECWELIKEDFSIRRNEYHHAQ